MGKESFNHKVLIRHSNFDFIFAYCFYILFVQLCTYTFLLKIIQPLDTHGAPQSPQIYKKAHISFIKLHLFQHFCFHLIQTVNDKTN